MICDTFVPQKFRKGYVHILIDGSIHFIYWVLGFIKGSNRNGKIPASENQCKPSEAGQGNHQIGGSSAPPARYV